MVLKWIIIFFSSVKFKKWAVKCQPIPWKVNRGSISFHRNCFVLLRKATITLKLCYIPRTARSRVLWTIELIAPLRNIRNFWKKILALSIHSMGLEILRIKWAISRVESNDGIKNPVSKARFMEIHMTLWLCASLSKKIYRVPKIGTKTCSTNIQSVNSCISALETSSIN